MFGARTLTVLLICKGAVVNRGLARAVGGLPVVAVRRVRLSANAHACLARKRRNSTQTMARL